jgi:hypothetical protein
MVGIKPRMPISTNASPYNGSHLPFGFRSLHSTLLLMLKLHSTTISFVSFPVMFSLPLANAAVTTQLPAGIGDVLNNGFTTVVAKGQARIRVQLSAAHDQQHLDKAIAAFTKVGKELGVLKTVTA